LLDVGARATPHIGHDLGGLGHEDRRLLFIPERCASLLPQILAVHEVDLGLLGEADAGRDIGRHDVP